MNGIRNVAARFGWSSVLFLLLAGVAGAVLADAQTPRPRQPAERHLLLVPDTPEGVAALARTDARVVARYGSFSIVDAVGGDERSLRAAGAERRDGMRTVTTAAGRVDPAERPSLAGKREPDRDEVLALIQFVGPPKDAWLQRLRATGARVVSYQPQNAYVVHARGAAVDRLAGLVGTLPAVRALTRVTAADKLEGEARGAARYAISTVAGSAGADARDRSAAVGPSVGRPATVGALRTEYRELSEAELRELARDPGVVAIERDVPPAPSDERAAQIVAGNLSAPAFTQPSGPDYLAWLQNAARFPSTATFPFAIDFTDSGLDNGADPPAHADFREGGSTLNPDRVAYLRNYTADPDADDCTGHGTNVASIASGYNVGTSATNEDGAAYNHGLGVAPFAQLGASKIFNCAGSAASFSAPTIAANAWSDGARVTNNSWGTGTAFGWGTYTTRSAQYDQLVRDAQSGTGGSQQMVEVFAAGNDGGHGSATIHAEGTAKNVITVGAAESVRPSGVDGCGVTDAQADSARDIIDFSSRGPTNDGRLKPDLVAPGTHITGARPLHGGYTGSGTCNSQFPGTTLYSLVSGTSQAAPQVSGAAALLRDWYTRNAGGAPSPALTKALLIDSATDLGGGSNGKGDLIAAGPNADQGWGRVNVGAALDSTSRELRDQLPADVLSASGQTDVSAYEVQEASKSVKVTLAWTDPPGSTMGTSAWVNDLDLEVAVGGQTYKGNVFAGALSRTGGNADQRNNVESVRLPAGTSGRVSVTVRATTLLGDGAPGIGDSTDQDFALVVSNAAEQPAPVLVHQATTVDDSGPGGDNDGRLESDEQVQLLEQVRNAGTDPASSVSGTFGAGGGLAVSQGGSAYPNLGAGAAGTNSTPYAGRLANSAPCGADVPAILTMASAQGTQAIPLAIPTGEPGAVQTDLAGGPVAIPDDDAGGVSSSVFVASRGRINDLDVTIPGIAHGWVGDLTIDVTGPDGTTVRLADHPGGPDNSGDNFSSTVFDDQAASNISQGSAPYTGSFRPQADQLSRFDGKSRRGTWTLRVRDLFEGDVGTLQSWGVTSQKALCDIDSAPPNTSITGFPGNPTSSRSAQFSFASDDPGATFECRLDGAAYGPCDATATFGGLGLGTHSVSARAIDGSDNEDPTPAAYGWTIAEDDSTTTTTTTPKTPVAATFTLAPSEARLADALAGRFTVLAACSAGCRASARLSVSGRTARRLRLGRKAVTLGSVSKRRSSAGTVTMRVRLGKRARAALRGRALTKATLRVTLSGDRKLTLERTVSLRRSAGLRRIATRGLRLWAACTPRCSLSGELTLSAKQARRLKLKLGSAARYEAASGRTSATGTPRLLTLRVRRAARKPLARARRVSALLEAVAAAPPSPSRSAKLSTTLRR